MKWLAGEFVSKTRSKSMRFGEPKMVEWPKEASCLGRSFHGRSKHLDTEEEKNVIFFRSKKIRGGITMYGNTP